MRRALALVLIPAVAAAAAPDAPLVDPQLKYRGLRVTVELELVGAELDWRDRQPLPPPPLVATAEVSAKLQVKVPGQLGAALVLVSDSRGEPVAGASVSAAGVQLTCDSTGAAAFDALAPGPLPVVVSAAGFEHAEETAMVVAGARVPVRVALRPMGLAERARLTGVVKSRVSGAALAADVEVVETQARARAGADGVFALEVPAGTYTVRISAAGHAAQTKAVTVKAHDRAIFNVGLHARQ